MRDNGTQMIAQGITGRDHEAELVLTQGEREEIP